MASLVHHGLLFIISLVAFTYPCVEGHLWGKSHAVLGERSGGMFEDETKLSRIRRSVSAFTTQEKEAIVEKHNSLRRMEGGADLKVMVWNSELADKAQEWSEGCVFDHGQPAWSPKPYPSIGQNLYFTTGSFDALSATQNWYDEKPDFDLDSNSCASGKACGHYTQIVWYDTWEVGCGWQSCSTMDNDGSTVNNANYLVCNYGPPGNVQNVKPYKPGPACTKCASGQMYCEQQLCRDKTDCDSGAAACTCEAQCLNCGTQDATDCSCSCVAGYGGGDCADICDDFDSQCGTSWPAYACNDASWGALIRSKCPKLCGLCVAGTGDECVATSSTTTTTPTTTTSTPSTTTTTSSATTTTTQSPTTTTTTTQSPTTTTTTTKRPTTTTTTTKRPTTTTTTTKRPTTTTSSRRRRTTTTTRRPATTTTTRPPTTSQSGIDGCGGYFCANGGVAEPYQSSCRCRCTDDWQGEHCEEKKAEARVGVVLFMSARWESWPVLWLYIRPFIRDLVNKFCNSHFQVCCPNLGSKTGQDLLTYITNDDLHVATNYPRYFTPSVLMSLIYATYRENNDLCQSGSNSGREKRAVEGYSSRFKRETEEIQSALDKDTLYDLLSDPDTQAQLTSELDTCCSVRFLGVQKAVVEGEEQDGGDSGLPAWAIALTVLVAVVAVAGLAVAAFFLWHKKPKRKVSAVSDPDISRPSTTDSKRSASTVMLVPPTKSKHVTPTA